MKPDEFARIPIGIECGAPLKTVSEANIHTHWRDRQKRAKGQNQFACLLMAQPIRASGLVPGKFKEHLVITLTRLSPQQLDSDNLAGSTKFVQDGVAEALGVDDRDSRLTWVYKQEKCKEYGVRVDIEREPGSRMKTKAKRIITNDDLKAFTHKELLTLIEMSQEMSQEMASIHRRLQDIGDKLVGVLTTCGRRTVARRQRAVRGGYRT